jgi:hypothetical protein
MGGNFVMLDMNDGLHIDPEAFQRNHAASNTSKHILEED